MCYMVYLASSLPIDVRDWRHGDMTATVVDDTMRRIKDYFSHPHVYYLASSASCSCEFRIALLRDSGFSSPRPWYPETAESIRGTALIYKLLLHVLESGGDAEIMTLWWDHVGKPVDCEEIVLEEIGEKRFRLFENRKFSIRRPTP